MLPLLVAGRAKLMIISLKEGTRGKRANQDGVVLQVLMEWKEEACSWLKTVYVVRGPRWYVAVKIALIWRIYAV